MTFFLHPGAERDIADAIDFYTREAGPSVARRFLAEFERAARLLVEHPDLGVPTSKGRRAFLLRVFPYSIVYRNVDSRILIIVVRHQHRRPGFAASRA